MATIKKISSFSDWNATNSNRIIFRSTGTARLYYLDYNFSGLSIDSIYWKIINQTGSSILINDYLNIEIDNSNLLNKLRSSNYISGDFDIYVSYEDLNSFTTNTDRNIYFSLSNEDIDLVNNINIKIGIGVVSNFYSISAKISLDNESTTIYNQTYNRNYFSGKLRIKKEFDTIYFYAEDLTENWELLGSFSDAEISDNDDLYYLFSSDFTTSTSEDFLSIKINDIIFSPINNQYDGNVYFDFELDNTDEILYYLFSSDSNADNTVSIRMKSAETESELDSAIWSIFKNENNSNFTISAEDKWFRINLKLLTTKYNDTPVLSSIVLGLDPILGEDETPSIISPSELESFDNSIRIIWKKPENHNTILGTQFYKIEYKNSNISIDDWKIIDSKVDAQLGFYDWDISNFNEDDNYEIRITQVFSEIGKFSEGLPNKILVENAGNDLINGIYVLIGIHNGENLYEGENGFLYFDGNEKWVLSSVIDNYVYQYSSIEIFGDWIVEEGLSPAPEVSEFIVESSQPSEVAISSSSSSYIFSSTSSPSTSSSSTLVMSTSSSESSNSSSSTSSTAVDSTSSSHSGSSNSSSLSSSSSPSSSTEKTKHSTSSLSNSSSTNRLSTSSSSSITTIFRGTGYNRFGQLAVGDNDNRNRFVKIDTTLVEDLKIISAGTYHTVIEKKDGTVWVAGNNDYGQLGLGDNTDRNIFVQLSSVFNNSKKIVCGENFTVIQKSDGTVWVTGRNSRGQLGLGDNSDRNSFEQLHAKYSDARAISAGSEFMMIEKTDGYLASVGANESGQLGLGDIFDRNEFEDVGIRWPRKIYCGSAFVYLEDSSGFVKVTGNNFHGQLGSRDNVDKTSFATIAGVTYPKQIVTGGSHVFVLTSGGILMTCGDNQFGQLGLGDNTDRNVLTTVSGYLSPRKISAGFQHSIIEANSGIIYSTGYNNYGQLGILNYSNKNVFTQVQNIFFPEEIVCGGYHSFILTGYAESESSTEVFNSSSSSGSGFNPLVSYQYGYFQSDIINMADEYGDFVGDAFIIPVNDISVGILFNVSTSLLGDWFLEKFDIDSSEYVYFSELKIGAEVYFDNLVSGDQIRVMFNGASGVEVYSYKVHFRVVENESSSLSTQIKSTSSTQIMSTSSSTGSSQSSSSTKIMSTSSESTASSSTDSSSSTINMSTSSVSSPSSSLSSSSSSTSTINLSTSSKSSSSNEGVVEYLTFGYGTNAIARSGNGISWTGLGSSVFSGGQGFGACWNGSMFVAFGSGTTNTIAYSTDGITWVGLGKSIFTSSGYSACWNGSMFVAAGYGTNTLAYSYNGISWIGLGDSIFDIYASKIAWNGTRFVAAGNGSYNSLAHSTNGISWTGLGRTAFSGNASGVCRWDTNKFMAVGQGTNSIAYSNDGITWTGITGRTILTTDGYSVCWDDISGRLVAVGRGTNTLAYSNNGINWVGLGNSIFSSGSGVCVNNSKFIAVGDGTNTVAYSYDGINWIGSGNSIFSIGWGACSKRLL